MGLYVRHIRIFLELNGTFCWESIPIGCFAYNKYFLSTSGACSEVVFKFKMKSNLFQFIEGQTHFSTSWHAKVSFHLHHLNAL